MKVCLELCYKHNVCKIRSRVTLLKDLNSCPSLNDNTKNNLHKREKKKLVFKSKGLLHLNLQGKRNKCFNFHSDGI